MNLILRIVLVMAFYCLVSCVFELIAYNEFKWCKRKESNCCRFKCKQFNDCPFAKKM